MNDLAIERVFRGNGALVVVLELMDVRAFEQRLIHFADDAIAKVYGNHGCDTTTTLGSTSETVVAVIEKLDTAGWPNPAPLTGIA